MPIRGGKRHLESKTQKGPHRQGMYSEAGSVHAEIAVTSKDPLRTKTLVRASRHGKQQSAEIWGVDG